MMQNSAVSFSICVDNDSQKTLPLISELKEGFKVQYNDQLTLCTIRHYDQAAIDKVVDEKSILVEQKSRKKTAYIFNTKLEQKAPNYSVCILKLVVFLINYKHYLRRGNGIYSSVLNFSK